MRQRSENHMHTVHPIRWMVKSPLKTMGPGLLWHRYYGWTLGICIMVYARNSRAKHPVFNFPSLAWLISSVDFRKLPQQSHRKFHLKISNYFTISTWVFRGFPGLFWFFSMTKTGLLPCFISKVLPAFLTAICFGGVSQEVSLSWMSPESSRL